MRHFTRYTLALTFLTALSLPAANSWRLIGWSDFGINPMERDYSLFGIYPPSGTIHAQLIDPTGALYRGASNVTMTYEAVADPNGSIDSTSIGKTNFAGKPDVDTGITGSRMPGSGNVPQAMTFDAGYNRFTGAAIPITPYDDSLNLNYYPLIKLTARDASGNVLATARITLPVSNEVECRGCHASGANPDAQPAAGYANDNNPNRDFKLNILQLHDEKNRRNPLYQSALASLNYSSSGILATATSGTAISCIACHSTNQFNAAGQSANPGIGGIESLTGAMHLNHAANIDPATGDILDNGTDRATCYNCHPGTHTQAFRGPMARSVSAGGSLQIQCQSCHGNMSALGDPSRNGWMDLPNCQACHIGGGTRLTNALNASGALNQPSDTTFATTPNAPTAGTSLYSYSTGHGSLQCSACHGSTHAELPSAQANDNLQAIDLTGSAGAIQECTICHQSGISSTNGGPHGMHDVGAGWVNSHTRAVGRTPTACQPCHGVDYKGTVLSQAFAARTLSIDRGTIQMFRGYQVGCYTCHNGPGGNGTAPATAVVSNTTASVASGQSTTIPVSVTNGGVLRIVTRPVSGIAYVSGNSITYQAQSSFEGTDQFTYAALNSFGGDSNLGTATVKVTSQVRPAFAASGVTNAASYASGIAPGMIAYIYGSGMGPANVAPLELNSGGFIEKAAAGTRVLFNGIPAPILYTSGSQASAIVPYGISGATANMVVEYNGIQSAGIPVPVSGALPGIFTTDASGKGQAAVLNQDGSFNSASNPAAQGSVVTFFVTGAGATSPKISDGKLAVAPYPVPAQPVSVTIGGQLADMQYAGGAPGEVAGLTQVNAVIPANTAPGIVPVSVSVGGVVSAAGVTVAVK
jgi:uncharacterized protein (TIGR03437 family)